MSKMHCSIVYCLVEAKATWWWNCFDCCGQTKNSIDKLPLKKFEKTNTYTLKNNHSSMHDHNFDKWRKKIFLCHWILECLEWYVFRCYFLVVVTSKPMFFNSCHFVSNVCYNSWGKISIYGTHCNLIERTVFFG